jgi:hypothetical protein
MTARGTIIPPQFWQALVVAAAAMTTTTTTTPVVPTVLEGNPAMKFVGSRGDSGGGSSESRSILTMSWSTIPAMTKKERVMLAIMTTIHIILRKASSITTDSERWRHAHSPVQCGKKPSHVIRAVEPSDELYIVITAADVDTPTATPKMLANLKILNSCWR